MNISSVEGGKMLNVKCGKMLNVVKCYHKIRSTPSTGSQTTKFEDLPNQETRKDQETRED